MKYLIPLTKITIEQAYKLFEQGYQMNFSYNGIIPYVEISKGA